MPGIAGIYRQGKKDLVDRMLGALAHRGGAGKKIHETATATIGMVQHPSQADDTSDNIVRDAGGPERKAEASCKPDGITLSRDELGVAPLYYGFTGNGDLAFASEVKALLPATTRIFEVLPGHRLINHVPVSYFRPEKKTPAENDPARIAERLRTMVEEAVKDSIPDSDTGAWLSGGLDSSIISALLIKHVPHLHTFVAGVKGAPDLDYAREAAAFIGARHHEVVVSLEEIMKVLPDVIFHLESFDALLVRSSILNYLAAREAMNYVTEVFSGEVADELFAGYDYLSSLHGHPLEDELIDITGQLHNTALQRVDRCASAHGLIPHVVFADRRVVTCALQIPVRYKLYDGIGKWILRKAMEGLVPDTVLWRPKAKFWQGGGIAEILADHASQRITDFDFNRGKRLPNGWQIRSKEELMYYRLFHQHFGVCENLEWMGRTKIPDTT